MTRAKGRAPAAALRLTRGLAACAVVASGIAAWVLACGVAGPLPAPGPTGSPVKAGGPAPPPPAPRPYPPAGKVFLGLQTNPGPADFGPVDAFAAATGHQPNVLQFSQGWAGDQFNADLFNATVARGMLPILSWEPWDYTARSGPGGSGHQPAYRLSAIIAGQYDDYIRSWAQGIAALPYPVVIRFAHEMNGFWYPWCEQANGNHPGEFVTAWRHVHDMFTATGARNVSWLWSPNVTYPGSAPLAALYPGDSYVDWIGLSGYYGTAGREAYISFNAIFARTLTGLATFTHRPVVITETGATNAAGQQARWIKDMFVQLPRHPQVIGVIWFESVKEIDWRIAAVPASAAAFAAGAASARYDTPWQTNDVPRT